MPTAVPPTKAVGYIRVSTDKQADHGVSLEAQQAKLTAYAALYDITLVDIIIDAGISAKTIDRPGLQQALSMLAKGEANALLIAKLDRLTRSVKDLGALVEQYFASDKITLLSVADSIDTRTAAGRLVLNVLGSVAQWEREVISERTTEALAHKKSQGQRTGGIPYGSTLAADGKTLLPYPPEQAVLERVRFHRTAGRSIRKIVAAMAQEGFASRSGKPFILGQIDRMLRQTA
jgi:site-specific DNA recombinase